jgi:hypothetical protein
MRTVDRTAADNPIGLSQQGRRLDASDRHHLLIGFLVASVFQVNTGVTEQV